MVLRIGGQTRAQCRHIGCVSERAGEVELVVQALRARILGKVRRQAIEFGLCGVGMAGLHQGER